MSEDGLNGLIPSLDVTVISVMMIMAILWRTNGKYS